MPAPYPIVEVQPDWALDTEEMGTKRKFWYLQEQQARKWLFKYPREDTGEHWAEKIASEIAKLLDIQHATIELAVCDERHGSVTESFVGDNEELIHGNQLLSKSVHGYDPGTTFRQSLHTLANICSAVESVFVEAEDAECAKLHIAEYLVLDALIGNTDRHHENWGILREQVGDNWNRRVAPSFDHASSLGRELTDIARDRLLSKERIGHYVERGNGAIYWSEDERSGPSPLDLVRRATCQCREAFRPVLQKLSKIDDRSVRGVIDRVPDPWMSASARKFAFALMQYNIKQLQGLSNE